MGALIVSCQAPAGTALDSPSVISALASAAEEGGAGGVRVEGVDDIAHVARRVGVPIIGLLKTRSTGRPLITPDFASCQAIAEAGAHMIAVEASREVHPHDDDVRTLIARIHDELGLPVMADISTLDEATRAAQAGADWVGTTLSGYTAATASGSGDLPDFDLLEAMIRLGIPSVLEGGVKAPEEVSVARRLGARAVVVGTAITDARAITAAFNRSSSPV